MKPADLTTILLRETEAWALIHAAEIVERRNAEFVAEQAALPEPERPSEATLELVTNTVLALADYLRNVATDGAGWERFPRSFGRAP